MKVMTVSAPATRADRILSLKPMIYGAAFDIGRSRGLMPDTVDELISAGWLGAIRAVDRYDETRGACLVTYARDRVVGEMLDEIRRSAGIRSRQHREGDPMSRCAACEQALNTDGAHIRPASHEPVPVAWIPPGVRTRPQTVSLTAFPQDAPIRDESYRAVEIHETLRAVLAKLKPRYRTLLLERFLEELSYNEMGRRRGVSESRACQLVTAALRDALAIARDDNVPSDFTPSGRLTVSARQLLTREPEPEEKRCPANKHVWSRENVIRRRAKNGSLRILCLPCENSHYASAA